MSNNRHHIHNAQSLSTIKMGIVHARSIPTVRLFTFEAQPVVHCGMHNIIWMLD
jgi:hypothetical protein